MGESGKQLKSQLGEHSLFLKDLENIKDYLQKQDISGTLLFSPAFPSYDQFADYRQRGERFKELFSGV